MKLTHPITMEMVVYLTDGEIVAKATVSMPFGRPAEISDIEAGIEDAIEQTAKATGRDVRACTKREFWREFSDEFLGAQVVLPGSEDWDEPA